ncbi:MAG: ABC transporter permease [Chloroflexota bacterium]|nr:ABC transporter permease [Chloroflexota bacterium]
MSQQEQEQMPEPPATGDQLHADAEVYRPQHPYSWSPEPGKKGAPRDEPPSSYHEPMIQRDYQGGYAAQDVAPAEPAPTGAQDKLQPQGQAQRRQRFSPDGDAFEQGYRPYNTRQPGFQVPPWARPQRNTMSPMSKIILYLVLAILFIGPLLGIILGIIALFLSAFVAIIVIVPFVLIGASVIFVIVALILRAAGVPIGRGRWRSFNRRRP